VVQKISWNSELSVGNATLDKQHRKLLELCSQVADCLEDTGPGSSERFHMILNDVGDYAFQHFQTEEAYLSQHGYPLLVEHKAEHMGLLSQLSQCFFAAGRGVLDRHGMYRILSEWLSRHMMESDMQYRDFIRSGGVEAATASGKGDCSS